MAWGIPATGRSHAEAIRPRLDALDSRPCDRFSLDAAFRFDGQQAAGQVAIMIIQVNGGASSRSPKITGRSP